MGRELDVIAAFPPEASSAFEVGDGAAPYIRALAVESDGASRPVTRRGDLFEAPECAAKACRIRYTVDIARAAAELSDQDTAVDLGGAYEAPPSTWLVRPAHRAPGTRIRLEVTTRGAAVFATGIPKVAGELDDGVSVYEASADDLIEGPYAALGDYRLRHIEIPGGTLDVAITPAPLAMNDDEVEAWVRDAATSLARYYGSFPAKHVLVIVAPDDGTRVNGTTMGSGGAAVLMRVGRSLTAAQAKRDWVLTHELIHTCFPTVGPSHRWMEEGLATYLEPVVRARAGVVGVGMFWRDLVEGLPQGLPGSGDRGLDQTPTWGRTYWGGALFWLLADVSIREATANAKSLEDALRAIAASGGSVTTPWPIERVLDVADTAVGKPVLRDLYDTLALAPGETDLGDLWDRLGVRVKGGEVTFREGAPLAGVRRAITAARASRSSP